MAKCLNCGKEISDNAKVCNYCGTPITKRAGDTKVCSNCGNEVSITAKVCRFCGTKFVVDNPVEIDKNYITWNIIPGQVAQKVTEREISHYGNVKGLIVQAGVKALFFINGKMSATLDAGKYQFKSFGVENRNEDTSDEHKNEAIASFFSRIASFLKGDSSLINSKKANTVISIVLIRNVEFPLLFSFKNVSTANIRSEVALHLIVRISNINEFYEQLLLDKEFVAFEGVSEVIEPSVRSIINQSLTSILPQEIEGNAGLMNGLSLKLKSAIGSVYPFLDVVRIIELSCSQADIENIRKLKEELYVAELELEQTQARNNFLNRLQNVDNSQKISEARSAVDFEAVMDGIDKDHELNKSKKEQFAMMLAAEKAIQEAKTDDDVQKALDELEKSGLLRQGEIDAIKADISHNQSLTNVKNEFELSFALLNNQKILDKEKLDWEIEIGNKRIQNEIERQRIQDDYSDARRKKEIELDKEEQLTQLEILRQAQQIRNEREDLEHKREIEKEKLHIDADLEKQKLYSTMTFDQIMASNPNITPEAAQALAKKYEADAMMAQTNRNAEFAMKQKEDMQHFMEQQMNLMRDMVSSKQRENEQRQVEVEHNQDRFMAGVQTAINSVAGALKPEPAGSYKPSEKDKVCKKCGAINPADSMFCSDCGESL